MALLKKRKLNLRKGRCYVKSPHKTEENNTIGSGSLV